MQPTISKPEQHRAALWTLGCGNVVSFFLAACLVLVLNPEDRISIARGSTLTALGFVYFMTLFEWLNVAALHTAPGARFRRQYRLSCGDILDINNKVVSAVQAALCCLTGAVVCLWSCSRDFLLSSHYMSEAYAWFGAAYFFYDIWSMYMVYMQMSSSKQSKGAVKGAGKGADAHNGAAGGDGAGPAPTSFLAYCRHEPVILFHHLFIGGFGFLVIVYLRGPLGDCTFGFVYLMELSTPLVSLRGILSRLGLKASRAYLANGLLMLLTFFVCRVASLPYVCLLYARVRGQPYWQAVRSLPLGCKVSIAALLGPQLYWFGLMAAGALAVLRGPRGAPLAAGDRAQRSDALPVTDSQAQSSEPSDKRS